MTHDRYADRARDDVLFTKFCFCKNNKRIIIIRQICDKSSQNARGGGSTVRLHSRRPAIRHQMLTIHVLPLRHPCVTLATCLEMS